VSDAFLDSSEFRMVQGFIVKHLPHLPRESKRRINHALLLTAIARARLMFGGDPELMPDHLAKWVILKERWPAVERQALRDPGVVGRLEAAANKGRVDDELQSVGMRATDPSALGEMLRDEPQLAPLTERLVYFKRAAPTVAPPAGSEPEAAA
jgi:hypothetical protein